jgi:hypothetical protein
MAKKTRKKATANQNMIMWVRLPKGIKVTASGPKNAQLSKILKKAGLNPSARCYGGSTCIA